MKYKLLCGLIMMPFLLLAQDKNKGVQFEVELSWQQVLQKAQKEHKLVFVDCYATWCGPCKEMDAKVYSNEFVGNYINAHFISVKAQFDTSKADNLFIKKWYPDAHELMSRYRIFAFPTFLFFSPTGQIIDRASGLLSDTLFLRLASSTVNDPEHQYYATIRKYRAHSMSYADMPAFADTVQVKGDIELADSIAKDYLENFLDQQSEMEIIKEANLKFIKSFWGDLTSKDKVFDLFYIQGNHFDEILKKKGYSQFVVDSVITREEIAARVWPNGKAIHSNPDWNNLHNIIKKKYDAHLADRLILQAKIRWFTEKNDWNNIAKNTIKKYETYGLDTTSIFGWVFLNNFCYNIIFKHSTNKTEIDKATSWALLCVKSFPTTASTIDTYANLLYKGGNHKKALFWEEKAAKLDSNDVGINKSFQEMKEGRPTWNQ